MPATDLHYSKVENLFLAALDVPEMEREAMLEAECGGDEALREAVMELLAARENAAAFLRDPTVGTAGGVLEGDELRVGAEIGPFKVLKLLGEGGFAMVYLAEQVEPIPRRVAVKVLKGGMDTRGVLARFEAERQTLARMDHPSIARVLDAGATPEGRPFFAMEFVDGPSITRYVTEKKLTLRERLALFIAACHAVQHAHHKGIIHRDLKPSNILVAEQDGVAAPKVIDFGIARATQPGGGVRQTQVRQFIGTPAYVSPEQASGASINPVDVRSDIYSLGVLLYELLTGATPFDADRLRQAQPEEIARILREEEPQRPSARQGDRRLEGDLDWITLKALEKEPSRRYDSVASLVRDLERHLADLPVEAGPPGLGYRVRKFIRRHRIGTAAAVLALGGLVAGGAVAAWGVVQARREAAAAKRETQKATAVIGLMNQMFEAADPDVARGNDFTVRQLLDDFGAEFGGQLATEPAVEFSLRLTMGRAYHGLGEYLQAQTHLERAAALAESHFGPRSLEMAAAKRWLGLVLSEMGHAAEGREALLAARDIEAAIPAAPPPETLQTQAGLAETEFKLGHLDEAARLATEVRRKEAGMASTQQRNSTSMARLQAKILTRQGHGEEAKTLSAAALKEARERHGEQHPRTILALRTLAEACLEKSELEEGRKLAEEAVELSRKTLGENHPATLAARQSLAAFHQEQGDPVAAEKMHAAVLDAQRKTLGASHPDTLSGMLGLVESLVAQGRDQEAEKIVSAAFQVSRQQYGEGNPITLETLSELAKVVVREGRYKDVEPIALRALAISQKLYGEEHENTLDLRRIIAFLFWQQQRYPEALGFARTAAAGYEKKLGRGHLLTLNCLSVLAQILDSAGQGGEADRLVREIYGSLLRIDKPGAGMADMVREFRVPLEKRGLIGDVETLLAHAAALKEKAGLNAAAEYRDLARVAEVAIVHWRVIDWAMKAVENSRGAKGDVRILVDALATAARAYRMLALPQQRMKALNEAVQIAETRLGAGDALRKAVRRDLDQAVQTEREFRAKLDAQLKAVEQNTDAVAALDSRLEAAQTAFALADAATVSRETEAILHAPTTANTADAKWDARRWEARSLTLRLRLRDRADKAASGDYARFLEEVFGANSDGGGRHRWLMDYCRQVIYQDRPAEMFDFLGRLFHANDAEPWKSGRAEIVLPIGSRWRVHAEEAPSDWQKREFDDSGWLDAPTAVGIRAGGVASVFQKGKFQSRWQFRSGFEINDPAAITAIRVRMRVLGEVTVHLNGLPVQVLPEPRGSNPDEAYNWRFIPRVVTLEPTALRPGSNLLAIESRELKNEAMVFDAQVEAVRRQ